MAQYLKQVFPQLGEEFALEHLDGTHVRMRLRVGPQHLRPGGTVSGPAMFALADLVAYVATMAPLGRESLAVTTNCALDFMRKPTSGADLIAHGQLLKLGKSLAVVDVRIYSEGRAAPVARANLTYSIPPRSLAAQP